MVEESAHGHQHGWSGIDTVPGIVPPGGIIMWSGAINAIPAGWALCDGTKGTPNLTDKFIMGAGATYAPGDIGSGGGATLSHSAHAGAGASLNNNHAGANTALTNNHNSHTHHLRGFIEVAASPGSGVFAWDAGSPNGDTLGASVDAHGVNVTQPTAHAVTNTQANLHGDHTVNLTDFTPPYYALAFIMRLRD